MNEHPLMALVLGIVFVGLGVAQIRTARFPRWNVFTGALYWLTTITPRDGSMKDETWVMINGVVMLIVGLAFLASWVFHLL
jgi:uncharacterized membrane protein HdeD (DUF308 family)